MIAGGRDDTVTRNTIYNNGAWGILLAPYPDTETPPPIAHCEGGVGTEIEGTASATTTTGATRSRTTRSRNNGFFGNPSNVDLAEISNLENPGQLLARQHRHVAAR